MAGSSNARLSMVGRVTLASSVLGSMTTFQMQHEKIPKATCQAIETAQRQFMWGDSFQQRKVHLVNWHTLCNPKNAGGLNFKKLSEMNNALLLKIGWRVISRPRDLWIPVLRGKYDRGLIQRLQCKSYPYDSSLWKAIDALWPAIVSNLKHCIEDGVSTEFWNNTWIDEGSPLINYATSSVDASFQNSLVPSYVLENGEWNISVLNRSLPIEVVNRIRAGPPLSMLAGSDSIAWKGSNHGEFTGESSISLSPSKSRSMGFSVEVERAPTYFDLLVVSCAQ